MDYLQLPTTCHGKSFSYFYRHAQRLDISSRVWSLRRGAGLLLCPAACVTNSLNSLRSVGAPGLLLNALLKELVFTPPLDILAEHSLQAAPLLPWSAAALQCFQSVSSAAAPPPTCPADRMHLWLHGCGHLVLWLQLRS